MKPKAAINRKGKEKKRIFTLRKMIHTGEKPNVGSQDTGPPGKLAEITVELLWQVVIEKVNS